MVNVVSVSRIERGRAKVHTSIEGVNRQDSRPTEDSLTVAEPLEIQLGYGPRAARRVKSISVTMRTPGVDYELHAGFLTTEGVVRDVNDIDQIVYASENKARISEEKNERASILPSQRNSLLLLSGHASFELLQKALMGGVSMVAAVGAPSSLAV